MKEQAISKKTQARLAELEARLAEAEETLRAIRSGEVDALVVSTAKGDQVFSLQGADRIYRLLVETMNEGAVTLAADGSILHANGYFAARLKRPLEKVIGTCLRDYVEPADREIFDALLRSGLAGSSRGEIRLCAADGKPVPAYLALSALQADDAPGMLLAVVTDLTEQKRSEAIVAAEKLARSILEQAAEAILVCDGTGRITHANWAAQRLCGQNPLLQPFDAALPLRLGDGTPFSLSAALSGVVLHGIEVRLERAGAAFDMLLSAGPLRGDQAAPAGCVVTLTDITERARIAEERERLLEQTRHDRESIAALAQILQQEWDTLQTIMESTPAQLAYLDREFTFVRVNSTYARNAGRREEDLIGHNYFDLFPDGENRALFEQVRATGQPVTLPAVPFESAGQPERGVTYWDWTLVPVKEGDGRVRGLVLSLLDVTDQVVSRRVVEELAARDEAILNSLSEGIATFDPAGNILTMNPAALRILGFGGIEHAEQRFKETPNSFEARDLNGEAVPAEKSPQTRLLRGETFGGYELNVRNLATGSTWVGSFSGAPVRDAAGRVIMGVLTLRDITAQKEAERERERLLAQMQAKNEELQSQAEELEAQAEELRSQAEELHAQTLKLEEERARLRAIIDSAPEAILVADEGGAVVLANPAAARLFAAPASAGPGLEHYQHVTRYGPDRTPYQPHELSLFRAAVHRETERDTPISLLWPDGQWREVLVSAVPILDSRGQSHGAVAVYQDITERVQAEAGLKAALAEKEVLMREIYHRVKNNVQALIYLMDMQIDYIPDEATRQMIRELQERARAMALVHEKLYQSQNLAQIDFGDYLYDLVDNLSHAFGAGRPIVWHIDVEDIPLGVDTAIPCGLIVSELLTNALKYAFPGGRPCTERGETDCTISVASRVDGDQITLLVADNGVGLLAEVDWATTKTLGLQLIGILARHQLGGQVEVDRHAGTSFKITFTDRERKRK